MSSSPATSASGWISLTAASRSGQYRSRAEREGLAPVRAEPPRADQRVETERSFELRGRGGVDLARCTHPSASSHRPRLGGMRLPLGFLLVAGVATVLVVGGGVLALGDGSDHPAPGSRRSRPPRSPTTTRPPRK